jgi:hypothetical protein
MPPKSLADGLLDEDGLRGDPTLEKLHATLGSEKASRVISAIGESALKEAPGLSLAALGPIVAQTLARLTPKEWASLAKGETSALAHAQAIVQESVKSQHAALVFANKYAAGVAQAHNVSAHHALSLTNIGNTGGKSGGRFSEMKENTNASDSATFSTLSREGFTPGQITAAMNFGRELGLKGTSLVRDIANSTDEEKDLYLRYRHATTDAERQAIQSQINALPPKKGEKPEVAKKRRDRIINGINNAGRHAAQHDLEGERNNTQQTRQTTRQAAGAATTTEVSSVKAARADEFDALSALSDKPQKTAEKEVPKQVASNASSQTPTDSHREPARPQQTAARSQPGSGPAPSA